MLSIAERTICEVKPGAKRLILESLDRMHKGPNSAIRRVSAADRQVGSGFMPTHEVPDGPFDSVCLWVAVRPCDHDAAGGLADVRGTVAPVEDHGEWQIQIVQENLQPRVAG